MFATRIVWSDEVGGGRALKVVEKEIGGVGWVAAVFLLNK